MRKKDASENQAGDWRCDTELSPGRAEGVANCIRQVGLAAEVRASAHVSRASWWACLGPTYFDHDGARTREYDVAAHFPEQAQNPIHAPHLKTVLCLAMEVKVARHTPWLLVRGAENAMSYAPAYEPLCRSGSFDDAAGRVAEVFRVHEHPLFGAEPPVDLWRGSAIVEPMKKGQGSGSGRRPRDSFAACHTACKAALALRDLHYVRLVPQTLSRLVNPESDDALVVTKPVVVLDGCLVSYFLKDDGKEEILKVDAGSIFFEFGTDEYKHRTYGIDVVTLDYLPIYMQRMTALARHLHDFHCDQRGH